MKEAFLRLRVDFLEICRGRVEKLRLQESVLGSEAGEQEIRSALDIIRRESHTIAGSSGTYGYSEVSAAAHAVETHCSALLSGEEEGLDAERVKEVFPLLEELFGAAERMFADPESGTVPF